MERIAIKDQLPRLIITGGVPIGITAVLWLTRSNEVKITQLLLAFFLVYVPWHSYLSWKKSIRSDLPVFAMISFMYWLYYAMPLFWEPHEIAELNASAGRELSEVSITNALFMVAVGITCLWLGMRIRVGRFLVPEHVSIEAPQSRRNYVRVVLALGCLLNVYDISAYTLGESGRQAMTLLLAVVPMLAFTMIFRSYLRHETTHIDHGLLLVFVVSRLVNGLSSGWLGVSTSLILICGVIYIAERRRMPRLVPILVVLFVLFFQVGKEDFRKTYWQEGSQGLAQTAPGGKLERTTFWVNRSLEKWSDVLNDPSGQALKEAFIPSVSRVSLLNQTANVIEMTPSIVPYQYGHLYSYLSVALIPRALWPEKPSINEANQFYQVAYGLTSPDDLASVSIAVGVLTEAYISFAWFGVVVIMLLIGIFLDFYQHLFFSKRAGAVLGGMGIVLLPQMLGIESQLAVYLGGIIQQVVFVFVVFLPALRIKGPGRRLGLGHMSLAVKQSQ